MQGTFDKKSEDEDKDFVFWKRSLTDCLAMQLRQVDRRYLTEVTMKVLSIVQEYSQKTQQLPATGGAVPAPGRTVPPPQPAAPPPSLPRNISNDAMQAIAAFMQQYQQQQQGTLQPASSFSSASTVPPTTTVGFQTLARMPTPAHPLASSTPLLETSFSLGDLFSNSPLQTPTHPPTTEKD